MSSMEPCKSRLHIFHTSTASGEAKCYLAGSPVKTDLNWQQLQVSIGVAELITCPDWPLPACGQAFIFPRPAPGAISSAFGAKEPHATSQYKYSWSCENENLITLVTWLTLESATWVTLGHHGPCKCIIKTNGHISMSFPADVHASPRTSPHVCGSASTFPRPRCQVKNLLLIWFFGGKMVNSNNLRGFLALTPLGCLGASGKEWSVGPIFNRSVQHSPKMHRCGNILGSA